MAKTKETPALLNDDHEAVLFAAIASLKNAEEVRRFMTDLCTRQEIAAFSERLLIARLLQHADLSYREISALTGASTTTIGRVARYLEHEPHQGYTLVLGRKK
ncbi:MAG: YerC/YecD family TrpR-related protein [Micavibrio sp.]